MPRPRPRPCRPLVPVAALLAVTHGCAADPVLARDAAAGPATSDSVCENALVRERRCSPVAGLPECNYNEMYNRCRGFTDIFRPEAVQAFSDCTHPDAPCTTEEEERQYNCVETTSMALPATDAQRALLTPLCSACPGSFGDTVDACLDTFLGRGDGGDIAGQFRMFSDDFIRQVVTCALDAAQHGDCHAVFMCMPRDATVYRSVCGDAGS